jgi:RNA-directed DNA polymerase
MSSEKPFCISKHEVMAAYRGVKANGGAAGVDSVTIEKFEENLENNLYKIWNRMSSGTYFPSPVRQVEIPKPNGETRVLGIPTIADRIAQSVAKRFLEPVVEPVFHPDSFGYRPHRSALDAVGVCRKRCWRFDWVIDLDIKGFFDNLDHDLVLKAVNHFTQERWLLICIERWLKAPIETKAGECQQRDKGTPQGGVISPLLANIFMHFVFDHWMSKRFSSVPFERYADDVCVHCTSLEEAVLILAEIKQRLSECNLEVHPDKTQIVYCKDGKRQKDYSIKKFDFLGYSFKPRHCRGPSGHMFLSFTPSISGKAAKRIRQVIKSWKIRNCIGMKLDGIARFVAAKVRGWINYYGRFRKSELVLVLNQLDRELVLWAVAKYRRFKRSRLRASRWLAAISRRCSALFVHWKMLGVSSNGGW